jgi:valyl-tRNA synthetase
MIKPAYMKPIDKKTYDDTLEIFDELLHIIHPFMPFITEELWQHIAERKEGESLMVDVFKLDALTEEEKALLPLFEEVKQIVSGVRGVRQTKNIGQREPLTLEVVVSGDDDNVVTKNEALGAIIVKMAGLEEVKYVAQKSEGTSSFLIGTREFAIPLGNLIDAEAEIAKAEAELKHLEGFIIGIQKKLSNERFVANAPEQVVALERKKLSDSQEKIATLKETIAALKK